MGQTAEVATSRSDRWFWLFVLWFLVCLGLYFWKIPPHPLQSLQYLIYSFEYSSWTWAQVFSAWGGHFLFFTSFLGALVVFQGTGNLFLRWAYPDGLTSLENWTWSLALGLGFWGLLAEGLAFENLFYPLLLRILILLALLALVFLDRWEALRRCWPFGDGFKIPLFWLMPMVMILLLCLSNLLVPEMSWDAITYQLIIPKFYFLKHGFYPVTGLVPAHYPSLGQMIFSWGLLEGNDSLARSFCFLAHLGTALALVGIGSRLSSPKIGWIAAAIYWAFPYLNFFSTRGYVDLFVGFYSVLGLGYLMVWGNTSKEKEDSALGILSAISLGLIWAIKYNAFSFWLAGILLFLAALRPRRPVFNVGFGLVTAPLFFFGPWALKSWFYVHNPVYPHLAGFFHTFDWTSFDAKASATKFHVEGLPGLLKLLLLPWTVIFENYGGAVHEEISLAFFLLLPVWMILSVLKWKELRWKRPFLTAIGVPLFFWLVTTHQLRLISGTMALAALPLAVAYQWALSSWPKFERSMTVLLGTLFWICAFYFFQGLANQPTPFACSLGFQTPDDFLGHVLRPDGYVSVANRLNQNLPPDAKVLIIGQQNGYYLNRISTYDFDYTYPVLKKWTERSATPEELYKQFQESGFTHILYNANAMLGTAVRVDELGVDRYPWKPEELKNYEQFFLRFTRKIPLPVGNGYSFYEVGPRQGFSSLPDYLPGTEHLYLKNMQKLMGLPQLADIIGKQIPSYVYLQSYRQMADQHPEFGWPCFQWAFGALGNSPEDAQKALQLGREGFKRNGDEASWAALQGDYFLSKGKMAQGVPFLDHAQQLSPEREDVARNLAVAYYNEKNLPKAAQEAGLAAALAPYSQEYRQLAQQLQSMMNR